MSDPLFSAEERALIHFELSNSLAIYVSEEHEDNAPIITQIDTILAKLT
jgi:hypothetical protein